MKKVKISAIVVVLLLLAFSVFAAQINSANYKQNVIVSTGGESVSSSSYKMGVAQPYERACRGKKAPGRIKKGRRKQKAKRD